MLRLFAAISPPDEMRDRLEAAQAGLGGWRPSPWENLHVTLAFFGEVDGRRAEDLDLALRGIDAPGFDLVLDGVDVFGGAKPRLAYAAVRADPALSVLRDKTRRAAAEAGIALEAERYVPHVTLARRSAAKGDERLMRWLSDRTALTAGPAPIDAFHLYRSDLGREAPVYTRLATYALTAP